MNAFWGEIVWKCSLCSYLLCQDYKDTEFLERGTAMQLWKQTRFRPLCPVVSLAKIICQPVCPTPESWRFIPDHSQLHLVHIFILLLFLYFMLDHRLSQWGMSDLKPVSLYFWELLTHQKDFHFIHCLHQWRCSYALRVFHYDIYNIQTEILKCQKCIINDTNQNIVISLQESR